MLRKIAKREAINRMNCEYGATTLASKSTHFANINAASTLDVWWLEVSYDETSATGGSVVDILLYDYRNDRLHHLRVPAEYFRQHMSDFSKRDEKEKISLWLSTGRSDLFRDQRSGVRFAQFCQNGPSPRS